MVTSNPFVLRDVSLTLTPTGGGTAEEYRCQLSQAELVPTAAGGGGASLTTFCNSYSDSGGNASWALALSGFQSYEDASDFSMLSFDAEGEEFDFVLSPMGGTVGPTNPGFGGTVTMVATNIGGTAGQYAVFTASLPCGGKPDKIVA